VFAVDVDVPDTVRRLVVSLAYVIDDTALTFLHRMSQVMSRDS